jgi:SPP1 family phage portal protein
MNYDTNSIPLIDMFYERKINYGRRKIILDYEKVDKNNIKEVVEKALVFHKRNQHDCEYLIKYFLGDQDILYREAPETSNINNQVVVNYAYPITREIVGYTFGNPIEYIQRDVGKKNDIEVLSDIYHDLGSYNVDKDTATFCSICGIGYQITLPSADINEDNVPEVPITVTNLDPRNTFCVFSNVISNPLILSCHIIHTDNDGDRYLCYTDEESFVLNDSLDIVEHKTNLINKNPITMFENSVFRTGDWEQAISVMNASNLIASDSLNDIEGTIRSLLVVLGAEFEDNSEGLKNIKKNRLLTLVHPQGGNVDAKFISPQVDSSSINNIREYLEQARNVITGIPDRQTASGGDTGTAVLNRNGWTDIEIVAKIKELFFKKAKQVQLGVGIKILQMLGKVSKDLSPLNIELAIGRNTLDNLQTKTQAFSTLVATGELATIDALEMSGLTNRVNEVVERGEKAKEEREQHQLEFQKEQQDVLGENKPEEQPTARGANNQEKKKVKEEKPKKSNNSDKKE